VKITNYKFQNLKKRVRTGRTPVVIGITGLIASGKTTVAGVFRRDGFKVIDVDEFARSLYKKGLPLYSALVKKYGKIILLGNGEISRKELAKLAFKDTKQYLSFCGLVFKFLNRSLKSMICKLNVKTVVLDMAVLFESGFYRYCDSIILVKSPEAGIRERLKKLKNRVNVKKALKFQKIFKMNKKIALSDFIIYNEKNKAKLLKDAENLTKKVKGEYGYN